ncbi:MULTISPECIES: maleylpyruvate isomerase N-terminal domain-containing protein [unclassified Streptomyces]|uniref:maleylpyruvate isomerase N-terminal domain-containing protein n=1 Tax=unclassified Streptomyces TaxID=2593676 RepID=UPI000700B744|nr:MULTISPECIES: maleylpyruvate isomerase N-terminal domain-containing protein [unclassified Streptomyces]KQX59310.1 MDMPI N domain containing protein [Streptomyces sp. Root1304]KRB00571.1 MDMPI N domain containing protein [Streptomyces sp. Root66D1]
MTGANDDADDVARAPWIPGPRRAADDHADLTAETAYGDGDTDTDGRADRDADGHELADGHRDANGVGPPPEPQPEPEPEPDVPVLSHGVLKSLLGAWALSACSAGETRAVEDHLTACAPCADEALRLRDAVSLLHEDRDLDLDPLLRSRVLENCLGRRPARIPVPDWVTPYDAETARLDALLRDIGESEWHAPVRLKWYEQDRVVRRKATVAGVIGHLLAVDGLVAASLGLDDPLGAGTPELSPTERTEEFWSGLERPANRSLRGPWREQSHALIRTVSFAGRGVADLTVTYKDFALPLRDSLLERAFECWVHADDIANAVAYPYAPPSGAHLHGMIDLAARLLPAALAGRRRTGLASPARQLVAAGAPGRSLHLEVEGAGGGHWYIALDSPAAVGSPERAVAQVAMDGVEFCQLVAGHISPEEAAAGQDGDREAIRDVLFAAASLSRL